MNAIRGLLCFFRTATVLRPFYKIIHTTLCLALGAVILAAVIPFVLIYHYFINIPYHVGLALYYGTPPVAKALFSVICFIFKDIEHFRPISLQSIFFSIIFFSLFEFNFVFIGLWEVTHQIIWITGYITFIWAIIVVFKVVYRLPMFLYKEFNSFNSGLTNICRNAL